LILCQNTTARTERTANRTRRPIVTAVIVNKRKRGWSAQKARSNAGNEGSRLRLGNPPAAIA
jgi:hypothetical protein